MSRKAKGRPFSAALFPFLAVLMCTMGALIVLLVVFIQRTRFDASALVTAQVEAGKSEDEQRRIRERIDDAQWRQEMLEKSRAEKTDELAQARSRVAHLEEHAQRLEAKAKELLERAQAIDEGKKLRDEDMAAAKAEAAKLKAEIEKKKEENEKAKKNSPQGQEWYALIPYDGRSGTRRRPIYVECTEFGVIIQPEGLRLTTEDFNGPLGPGNPLDSALRAIRDYWERSAGTNAGQPYPLLVVRPSGVIAFRAARAGISAWDDEWGYELINDDKMIDFGPPDPALNATINKTVSVARQRQAAMIAMMPRRFQNEEPLKSFAPEPASATGNSRYVGGGGGIGNGPGGGSGLGGGSGANGNGVGANGSGVGNGTGIGGRFGGGNAGQAGGGIARGGYGNGPGGGGPGSGNGQTGNGGGNGAPGSGYGPAGAYAGGGGAMGYGAGGLGGAGGNGLAGGNGPSGTGNGNGLGGTDFGAGGAGNGGANNGGPNNGGPNNGGPNNGGPNNGLAGTGTGSGGSFGGGATGSGASGIPSIAAAWNTNSANNDQRFGATNQNAPGMIGGGGGANGGDAFPGAQSGGDGTGSGGSGGGPGGNGAGGSSYGTAGGQGGTGQGGASQNGTGQYAASPGGQSAGGSAGGAAGGSGAGGGQFRSTMAPQSGGGGSSGAMGAGGGQSASSGTSIPFLLPTTPGSAAAHTDAATPGGGQPGFGQLPTNAGSQRGGDTGPTYGVDVAKRGKSGRGKNWALPQAKPTSIGVTRPIHISVEPNRVVMYPERGDSRAPKVVALAPELSPDDVTHFVDAVQNEVKGWGLAVSEGYWKPVLQADIAPGAERQYMNLETALHGSGIEVTRR